MPDNLIRVQQLNQTDLNTFVLDKISAQVDLDKITNSVSITGTQTINGIKNFSARPTVNGTGILLSGELSQSQTSVENVVYVTGSQTINGVKTFVSGIDSPNLVYNTGNQTISGTKTFVSGIDSPNLVYNTGNQTIGGTKNFTTRPQVNNINVLLSSDTVSQFVPPFPPDANTRRIYFPDILTSFTSVNAASSYQFYFPIYVRKNAVSPRLCYEVTTNSTPAISVRLGIYSGNNGILNAPLFWSGSVATTGVGIHKTPTSSIPTLAQGFYILSSAITGTNNSAIIFRSMSNSKMRDYGLETTYNVFIGNATSPTVSNVVPYEIIGSDIKASINEFSYSTNTSTTLNGPVLALEY